MIVHAIVGTRPEVIKMAPVITKLREISSLYVSVVVTAQHRELTDDALAQFALKADVDLDLMLPGQTPGEFSGRCLSALDSLFGSAKPDYVLAQGDTSTVMCAALAAYYRNISFGHVEAGLRSGDFDNPFPEEMNRVLISRLASHHFCPTESAARALRSEGYQAGSIFVTGNTVIDALLQTVRQPSSRVTGNNILVTMHRRENFPAVHGVIRAIRALLERFSDLDVTWPVHPNPSIHKPVFAALSDHPRVRLVAPLPYRQFIEAMVDATLILSDSGGVQEEAPALGVPVLVLRSETERPEGVSAGVTKLIGVREESIVNEVSNLLTDANAYAAMAEGGSPYGDGKASSRIADVIAALALENAA